MKTIEIIQHGHIESRRNRPFFLVAAYMQVVVIGSSVGQLMNQRRVAVKRKDDRLVASEQCIEGSIAQPVWMF